MSNNKIDLNGIISQITESVTKGVEDMTAPTMIPTGALEPMIEAVGNHEFRIVNAQCANKLGKTTLVVNILKNIFWEHDSEYFNYPAFKVWPYVNNDGTLIKHGRIICTAENAKENGPIDTEIQKWWPKGRYTRTKDGKGYYSKYKTDTGWSFDVLTFDQDVSAFEGPMMSWQWCDEPPKARLMGAIMSRFSKGGILMLSQTPINAGPFISVLSDLKDRGTKIKTITASIFDNSAETGKLNSKGTKRGLMTDKEIEDYITTIPVDERESRLYGKAIGKSGTIYPMFDEVEHVRHYDLAAPYTKKWNGYCIMDPHDKYYPFIQWWAVLPPNEIHKVKYVLYNEWPNYDTLGGYYDEKRKSAVCNLTPKEIAKVIKIYDGTQYGIQIKKRGIDPRFARNTESNYSKSVEGIIADYARHDIDFELPDQALMTTARDRLRNLLKFDKEMPTHIYNEPSIFMMPHCVNSIRAINRTYWEDGKDKEAEEFKDPIDCIRMFLAMEKSEGWTEPNPPLKKDNNSGLITQNLQMEFAEVMGGFGLG